MKKYRPLQLHSFLLGLGLMACHAPPGEKDSRVSALPYYREATFTPYWWPAGDPALDSLHQIPSFALINQEGDTITEQDLRGKVSIANFFFTVCPGICPKMTHNLTLVQKAFRHDPEVLLLSHSVMPAMDSVPVLKAYAEAKGVESGRWHLLTGKREQLYALGRNAYFVEEDLGLAKEADEFLHTENLVLIDRDLHIRGIYNGLSKNDIHQLIADIRTLKEE